MSRNNEDLNLSGNNYFNSSKSLKNSTNSDLGAVGGCPYPDEVIMDRGVAFNVRYIGCLEVKTSMKTLDFTSRSQVARECINRVCEVACLKNHKKRKLDKRISQYISDRPCMEKAGTNVILNVSSKSLNLVSIETGEMIANHDMPTISFASGGDTDTLDFLAYVAKNEEGFRACYVIECGGDQTQNLILTIGRAFLLRFNAINKNHNNFSHCTNNFNIEKEYEKDYYNDLPGKLAPDLLNDDLTQKKSRNRLSSNLIDLNSPPPDHPPPQHHHHHQLHSHNNDKQNDFILDNTISAEIQRSQLMTEPWFHTSITRPIAESLLKNDGDFLVRESSGKPGQYVLTGLEGKIPKHLLLIDPEGIVRTKDRIFDSISHLINYHWTNALPIISEETELVLRNPVLKTVNNIQK